MVVLKEVMDNALDACEEAEIAPVISIAVTPGLITIRDNGGGIETDTIKSIRLQHPGVEPLSLRVADPRCPR